MKIIAIQTCTEGILNCPRVGGLVEILFDRQAVVEVLQDVRISPKVMLDYHSKLRQLTKNHNVTLTWVPSNSGIIG